MKKIDRAIFVEKKEMKPFVDPLLKQIQGEHCPGACDTVKLEQREFYRRNSSICEGLTIVLISN